MLAGLPGMALGKYCEAVARSVAAISSRNSRVSTDTEPAISMIGETRRPPASEFVAV
jgi:hypothetical protein